MRTAVLFSFFFLMIRRPPRSTLFPYTTLFRSLIRKPPEHLMFMIHVDGDLHQNIGCCGLTGIDWKNRNAEVRSEEHTSELQSQSNLVCRLLLEKKKHTKRGPEQPGVTDQAEPV